MYHFFTKIALEAVGGGELGVG